MPGDELEPIGYSGPALAEVAADMSEIFERAGLGEPTPSLRRPSAVSALRPSGKNGSTAILLTAAAAAGIVGLGAGALVLRTPGSSAPAVARLRPESQPRPSKPEPPSPATPPISLAEAAPAPPIETAPAPAIASAPAPTHPAAKASSAAKGLSRASRSRAEFRAKLARLDGPTPAEARPPTRLGAPASTAQTASCEQEPDGEACRRAVVQADRHLRSVYQSAFERGVSRKVLVGYRDRWADLRERNNDDPTRLIESYSALAYDLGSETAGDEDNAPRTKSRSGLRALADLLLPWR
jgi:hypothetical protein